MLKKLAFLAICACAIALPSIVKADYFKTYSIETLDTTSGTLTLSDGSQWSINVYNLPNVTNKNFPWAQGEGVFMIPVFPGGGWSEDGVSVVMINESLATFSSAYATMTSGSTQLTLTSLNQSTGIAVLSDGTQWQLDPAYQKYYSTWQNSDPITPAGYRIQKYLINGNSRSQNGSSSMSFANARETSLKVEKKKK